MTRKHSRWRGAVGGAAALTGVLVAILFARSRCADHPEAPERDVADAPGSDSEDSGSIRAEGATPGPLNLRRPVAKRPAPKRPPLALHPADPDAVAWEELNPDERAELAKIQQWAELEHGREAHERWRDATTRAVERFQTTRAARAVGLEGIVYLGVLP